MKITGKHLYICAVLLLPILFQYSAGFSSITLGDVFLIASVFFMIILNIDHIKLSLPFILLLVFILLQLVVFNFMNLIETKAMWTALRYCVYLMAISFSKIVATEHHYIIKIYRKIALISAGFLIFQVVILTLSNVYIPGVITGLQLTDQSLYDYSSVVADAQVKRCMAFFGEPSHFVIYEIGYLTISLFSKNEVSRFKEQILISLSIVLSTSLTGMVLLMLLWLAWLFLQVFINKKYGKKLFLSVSAIMLALIPLSQTDAVRYFLNEDVFNRQLEGRIGAFEQIWDLCASRGMFSIVFGHGMNDIGNIVYLSGIPRLLYYFGIIGFLVFVFVFVSYLRKRNWPNNMLLFDILILSVVSEMIVGPFILVFLLPIISFSENGESTPMINHEHGLPRIKFHF